MIDYALEVSGEERLHYVGHSQGTTTFFVMGSMRPAYNAKIISMHGLAPVAYMANNRNLLFNILAPFSTNIEVSSSACIYQIFFKTSQLLDFKFVFDVYTLSVVYF